jgi:hypothetical protein
VTLRLSIGPWPGNGRLTSKALVLVGSVALVFIAACGGNSDATPDVVTGVITEVTWKDDRTAVQSFKVDAQGDDYEIRIDDEVDYGFDLAHLEEHRDTHEPVRVKLRDEDGRLFAERIDDA